MVRTRALQPAGTGAGRFLLLTPDPELLLAAPPGNLDLLPPPGQSAKPGDAPVEHKGLVSHNGSLIDVGNLLQRAEQQDSGRLYLENKIHTLELKLGEWAEPRGPVGPGRCVSWRPRGKACSLGFGPLALIRN